MKLVDILARELKAWPDNYLDVGQADEGCLHLPGIGQHERHTVESYTKADDWFTAIVTRAQWQAAVDALKDDEVVYSAENVSLNANYATHTNSPVNAECKIVHAEWTGEGLPPAGIDCEFQHRNAPNGIWHPTTIRFSSHAHIIYVDSTEDCEACYAVNDSCGIDFRPIRTPEQIAKEESAKAIDQMVIDSQHPMAPLIRDSIFAELYAQGYRKQEEK